MGRRRRTGRAVVKELRHRRDPLGALDLGLSVAWIYCFVVGHVVLGIVFPIADFGHAFVVTIRLLTGNVRDGDGHLVCQRPAGEAPIATYST